MTENTTKTIHIRSCLAAVIAVVMALTMFTGVTGISHAAAVTGAKATNYGFRMVRVSWKAVKVEIPQEPAEPEEPQEPEDTSDPAVEPSGEQAPDQNDPAADPSLQGAEPADSAADPAVQSDGDGTSAPADPAADPVDPGVDSSIDPAVQSGGDEPSGEPATDPAAEPAVDLQDDAVTNLSDEPAAEPPAEPDQKPVYDVITYKVYRSTAKSGKYSLVKTTKETSFINKGLTIGKTYFYKIIAYRSNGEKYGTSSIVSIKVAKQVTAKMTLIMKGNTAFNFRTAAKQKLYQYDTLQGACANGGYAYLTLYNRRVERCKIVKVKLSNLSIVKVSASLPIYHGNNLTYNTRKNRIVATCCTTEKSAKNRVVFINPKTLKVTAVKNIKLTKKVKKLPKKVWKKNKGYTAIAYNEKHNCYVARLRQNDNIVILNKDLKPLRYVVLKGKKTGLLVQGIETVGDYIYDVRSFKGRYHYCMVTVHTMSGKYVGQMKFPIGAAPGRELECIFHNGKQFYAGFYYSTSQMDDTKRNHVNRVNLIQRLNNL